MNRMQWPFCHLLLQRAAQVQVGECRPQVVITLVREGQVENLAVLPLRPPVESFGHSGQAAVIGGSSGARLEGDRDHRTVGSNPGGRERGPYRVGRRRLEFPCRVPHQRRVFGPTECRHRCGVPGGHLARLSSHPAQCPAHRGRHVRIGTNRAELDVLPHELGHQQHERETSDQRGDPPTEHASAADDHSVGPEKLAKCPGRHHRHRMDLRYQPGDALGIPAEHGHPPPFESWRVRPG